MLANIPLSAILIAIVIVISQSILFWRSRQKIELLKNLFPDEDDQQTMQYHKSDDASGAVVSIVFHDKSEGNYEDFQKILTKINKYLEKVAGNIVDYDLIKEISESEYNKLINEIELNLPRPLYVGLMGTFIGVILGISEIIDAGELDTNNLSAIVPFLSHIGTAMVASLFGLAFTSLSTNKMFKVALRTADHNKTEFLNTIKYEVLPKLNKGVSDILAQVASSLTKFNASFTVNIQYFQSIFKSANDNIEKQMEFVQRFEKLKLDKVLTNIDGVVQNIIRANQIFENFGQLANKLDHSAKNYEMLLVKSREVMNELGVYRDGIEAVLSVTKTYKENSSALKEAAFFFNSQHGIFDLVLSRFKDNLDALILGYNNDLDKKQIALVEKRDDLLRHFDAAMDQLRNDIPAGKLEKLDQLDNMYEAIRKLYAETIQTAQHQSGKMNDDVIKALKSLETNLGQKLDTVSRKLEYRNSGAQKNGGKQPPPPPPPPPPLPEPTKSWWRKLKDKFAPRSHQDMKENNIEQL